jgi:hypothetical protein
MRCCADVVLLLRARSCAAASGEEADVTSGFLGTGNSGEVEFHRVIPVQPMLLEETGEFDLFGPAERAEPGRGIRAI